MPHLVKLTTLVRESFIEAARDFRGEGWLPEFPVGEVAADFAGYVQRVLTDQQGLDVPASTLWYIDGITYLGTVIRHRLTPRLTPGGAARSDIRLSRAVGGGGTPPQCWQRRLLTAGTLWGLLACW
jgi:hypothetical protein